MAVVREARTSRTTGTTVEIIDLHAKGAPRKRVPQDRGRFATRCKEHGTVVPHRTWYLERLGLGHPEVWCDGCGDDAALVARVQSGEATVKNALG